jgi:hypothetical protein
VRLPPPDPNERSEAGFESPIPAPTAVFPLGPPSGAGNRMADRLLELRPGLLFVLARD